MQHLDWIIPLAWFALIVVALALGLGMTPSQLACHAPFHLHDDGLCHRHCHNGMSLHNSTHGQDCSVPDPINASTPKRRTRTDAGQMATAVAVPTPGPTWIDGTDCVVRPGRGNVRIPDMQPGTTYRTEVGLVRNTSVRYVSQEQCDSYGIGTTHDRHGQELR